VLFDNASSTRLNRTRSCR